MRDQHLIAGKRLSDAEFSVQVHVIVNNTLNVKTFALARPSTVKVYTALNAFDKSLLKTKEAPSKVHTLEKYTARTALEDALNEERNAINFHYAGNSELMLTSGFELSQTNRHQTNEPPKAPEFIDLFVYPKESGMVEFKIDRVAGVEAYVVEYRQVIKGEDTPWQHVLSAATGRVTHLKSEMRYEFQAAGVNTYTKKQDEYHFSNISSCVVQ